MGKHSRAKLALEILKTYSPDSHYAHLTEDRIDLVATDIMDAAKETLLNVASPIIDEIMDLGFSNKEIAKEIGVDEGTLSRVHSRSKELQHGCIWLKELVIKLRAYSYDARVKRLSQIVVRDPSLLTVLDPCSSRVLTDEVSSAIKTTVGKNLIYCLTQDAAERLPLPDGIDAVLVQIGPRERRLYLLQIEGTSDVEGLRRMAHELEDLRDRINDEADRKKNEMLSADPRQHQQRNTPKSAF